MALTKQGEILKAKRALKKDCVFPECIRKTDSKYGLCNIHYRVLYSQMKKKELDKVKKGEGEKAIEEKEKAAYEAGLLKGSIYADGHAPSFEEWKAENGK